MTHKWGRMATYPKLGESQLSLQEERPHGETPHSMRVYVPSPNRPYPWSSGARNLGPNIMGETGFVAILRKTAKIHPKVVTRKMVPPYHKRNEPRAFAWMQTEALPPFCNKGWGSKHNRNSFDTSILEAHYIWEKVICQATPGFPRPQAGGESPRVLPWAHHVHIHDASSEL